MTSSDCTIPLTVTPALLTLCPQKEVCGSCSWSEMPYEIQLKTKLEALNQGFEKAHLSYRCEEILPSPQQSHYRNRMDFVIDFEGRVGLRQKGKWWRVIDNHHCFISDLRIERAFKIVREWVQASGISYFDRKRHHGLLRFALIRASTIGETLVDIITSLPSSSEEEGQIRAALEVLAKSEEITSLVWSTNSTVSDVSNGEVKLVQKGSGYLHEEILGLRYRISPHAFFQTNSHAAPLLLSTVRDWAKACGAKKLLDLYCGTGFFAVALAPFVESVLGVEMVQDAIVDARENARVNKAEVEFICAPSEDYDWSTLGADAVIIDPPRGGMHEKSRAQMITARPQHVFYVSCNHKHFITDVAELSRYYEVRSLRLVDLFPHTPHVELVSWLERRS